MVQRRLTHTQLRKQIIIRIKWVLVLCAGDKHRFSHVVYVISYFYNITTDTICCLVDVTKDLCIK